MSQYSRVAFHDEKDLKNTDDWQTIFFFNSSSNYLYIRKYINFNNRLDEMIYSSVARYVSVHLRVIRSID